jgi:hypothetical protein
MQNYQKYQDTNEVRYLPKHIPLGTSALAVLVFAADGELTKRPRDRKPRPARVARRAAPAPAEVGQAV